jgi:hypothetical protein
MIRTKTLTKEDVKFIIETAHEIMQLGYAERADWLLHGQAVALLDQLDEHGASAIQWQEEN